VPGKGGDGYLWSVNSASYGAGGGGGVGGTTFVSPPIPSTGTSGGTGGGGRGGGGTGPAVSGTANTGGGGGGSYGGAGNGGNGGAGGSGVVIIAVETTAISSMTVTTIIAGSKPIITGITKNIGNSVTVAFTQSSKGTTPVTYYYSLDGSSVRLDASATASPITITGLTNNTPYSIYVVANNSGGNVFSDPSFAVTILGTTPTLTTSLVLNADEVVRLTYTQTNAGTTPVTYFYTTDNSANTTNRTAFPTDSSTVDVSNVTGTPTYYVIASNSAGNVISSGVSGTPYLLGSNPTFTAVPVLNSPGVVRLTYSQATTGTTPVTYFYTADNSANTTNRTAFPTDSSTVDVSNVTGTPTYYVIASNIAGNVISDGSSVTPYLLGSKPTISSVTPNIDNQVTINFTQSPSIGNGNPVYYYGFDGSSVRLDASATSSPLVIRNLNGQSPYSIYVVARNEAGDISSNSFSGINVLGTKPIITSITRNISNSVTVTFEQSQKGTGTTTYYGSINGSSVLLDASSSGTSLTISNLIDASAYSIYVIAINPAGSAVSDPSLNVSILGTQPSFTLVSQTNNLRGTITQTQKGTLPVRYYYSSDGVDKEFEVSFPTFDISGTVSRTFSIIADNSAGQVASSLVTGTPFIFGTVPSIGSIVPGSEKLIVNFSQDQTGTTPVKYFYSYDPSGTTRIAQVNPPSFDISGTQARTVYIVADNSAGTIVSAGVTGTPYTFGSALNISLSAPISNIIRVSYSQAVQGTVPTTYQYILNGGSRVTVGTSRTGTFDISGLTSTSPYSFYMVATNDAGDLSSNTVSQAVLGAQPIATIVPEVNNIRVSFTQSETGTLSVQYYYSFDGVTKEVSVNPSSPFNISGVAQRTVYIIAENPAGQIVSTGVLGTPYFIGDAPLVDIQPGSSNVTVYFSPTLGNPAPTYYYSEAADGSNPIGPVTSPFTVNTTVTKTIYVVASNIAGTVISSEATATPFLLGNPPTITSIVSGLKSMEVNFMGSTGGNPAPYAYYYSLNGGSYILARSARSPIIIAGLSVAAEYEVRLVAQNSAGFTSPSNTVNGSTLPDGEIVEFNSIYVPPRSLNADSGGSVSRDRKSFINSTALYVNTTLPLEAQQKQRQLLQKSRVGVTGRLTCLDVAIKNRQDAIGRAVFSKSVQPESETTRSIKLKLESITAKMQVEQQPAQEEQSVTQVYQPIRGEQSVTQVYQPIRGEQSVTQVYQPIRGEQSVTQVYQPIRGEQSVTQVYQPIRGEQSVTQVYQPIRGEQSVTQVYQPIRGEQSVTQVYQPIRGEQSAIQVYRPIRG